MNPFINYWATFASPLSGNVNQQGMFPNMLNTNITIKGDISHETGIITGIASYGSQLGTLIDAIDVLLKHVDVSKLHVHEKNSLDKFNDLKRRIDLYKEAVKK